MSKLFMWVGLLAAFALISETGMSQTFQNGPYYAKPSWDQEIPAGQRFIVLSNWNNAAVLDRETGLVWQRTPGFPGTLTADPWINAAFVCHKLGNAPFTSGINRLGWRLPSVEELASLIDMTQSNPALPAGHPFQGVQSDDYWTATSEEGAPERAYIVGLNNGFMALTDKTAVVNFWCVRGGSSVANPTN
jgi:hypothetical protein